jgi:hypothetical protein
MGEKERNVTRRAIAMVLFVVCFAAVVLAFDKKDKDEDKLRMVSGLVADAQENPLAGAVVQLKNSKTLQVRSFITQDGGTYQFHGLDPNVDYSLKADFQGGSSSTKTLSSFDSRKKPVINLKVDTKK